MAAARRTSALATLVRERSAQTGMPAETILRSLLRGGDRHHQGPLGACRVNGGMVPPRYCATCRDDHEHALLIGLSKLDRQANRGR